MKEERKIIHTMVTMLIIQIVPGQNVPYRLMIKTQSEVKTNRRHAYSYQLIFAYF